MEVLAGGDLVSGEMGSESVWGSESESLPTPNAGFTSSGRGVENLSSPGGKYSGEVSISGFSPHPSAKLEREWKCTMTTRACASSATDQLSAPLSRLWREGDGKEGERESEGGKERGREGRREREWEGRREKRGRERRRKEKAIIRLLCKVNSLKILH